VVVGGVVGGVGTDGDEIDWLPSRPHPQRHKTPSCSQTVLSTCRLSVGSPMHNDPLVVTRDGVALSALFRTKDNNVGACIYK
jgi:hypothetical protein